MIYNFLLLLFITLACQNLSLVCMQKVNISGPASHIWGMFVNMFLNRSVCSVHLDECEIRLMRENVAIRHGQTPEAVRQSSSLIT